MMFSHKTTGLRMLEQKLIHIFPHLSYFRTNSPQSMRGNERGYNVQVVEENFETESIKTRSYCRSDDCASEAAGEEGELVTGRE